MAKLTAEPGGYAPNGTVQRRSTLFDGISRQLCGHLFSLLHILQIFLAAYSWHNHPERGECELRLGCLDFLNTSSSQYVERAISQPSKLAAYTEGDLGSGRDLTSGDLNSAQDSTAETRCFQLLVWFSVGVLGTGKSGVLPFQNVALLSKEHNCSRKLTKGWASHSIHPLLLSCFFSLSDPFQRTTGVLQWSCLSISLLQLPCHTLPST